MAIDQQLLEDPKDSGIKPLDTGSLKLRWAALSAFGVLFLGFGLWMAFATIEGAVVATGSVVVAGKPKIVQHLDGGIVAEIYVSDGDKVAEGDLLLRLDETILKSNLEIYSARLSASSALRDRLRAEEKGSFDIEWDSSQLERFGLELQDQHKMAQVKLMKARKATRSGQASQLREKILQFQNQTKGLNSIKKSKNSQVKMMQGELNGLKELQNDGYVPLSRVMTIERQIQELSGQIEEHGADISRIQNSIQETRIQVGQINREFFEAVLNELRESELSIADLVQQITATQEQLNRVEILAPTSGVIHESNIFTIGGVVGPGATVMTIVPNDIGFVFEVNLEPQYIDQVYVTQDARILFSAFNLRTTPELNGNVSRVSPNTSVQEDTGFPYYTLEVDIPQDELDRLEGLELISGMPLEVFITTNKRSPLNYLLKPLTDNFRRSLKEE